MNLGEEAIAFQTIGMDKKAVRKHIDLKAGHTEHIFAVNDRPYRSRNVLYITTFSSRDIRKLIKNFPAARNKAKKWKYKEKDALAVVRFGNVIQAIKSSKSNTGITVTASVTNLAGKTSMQKIILRPVFAKLLRSYVDNKSYTQGKNPKIRFYTL